MGKLHTITQVTRAFRVSARMLRYYEQIGLLQSRRMEGYSYRVYDEESCLRLRQIIILRQLRIPLKQIAVLLSEDGVVRAIEIFTQNIRELDEEIDSLLTIRDILKKLMDELRGQTGIDFKFDLLNDTALELDLISVTTPLSTTKQIEKERKTMDNLSKANEQLNKLTDRDIRIVYLPPAVVAAYQYVGNDPEMHVNQVIDRFVRDSDLIHKKPDTRHYGFNAPNPVDDTGYHGYEMWVTVPEDMSVPTPLVKKHFVGGLYAAYMIPFGAFEEWGRFDEWVRNSKTHEYNGNMDHQNMFGYLEEHLNYVSHVNLENTEPEGMQLDLLIPVKERSADA